MYSMRKVAADAMVSVSEAARINYLYIFNTDPFVQGHSEAFENGPTHFENKYSCAPNLFEKSQGFKCNRIYSQNNTYVRMFMYTFC